MIGRPPDRGNYFLESGGSIIRKWLLIIIFLIGAAILTGYLLANGFNWPFPKKSAQQQQNNNAGEQQEKPDPIKEQLDSLTLEEKSAKW